MKRIYLIPFIGLYYRVKDFNKENPGLPSDDVANKEIPLLLYHTMWLVIITITISLIHIHSHS